MTVVGAIRAILTNLPPGTGTAALLIIAVLLGHFVVRSTNRERLAVLCGWLFPGFGHVVLGRWRRGAFFAALLVLLFLAGMILAGFRNISPLDRHPIWAIAHVFGGLLAEGAALATRNFIKTQPLRFYEIGCLYSAVATLLNVLATLDAYDLARAETRAAGPAA